MNSRETVRLNEMTDEERLALRRSLGLWLGSIHQQSEFRAAFVNWLESQPEGVLDVPSCGVSASHVIELALSLPAFEVPVKMKINHKELGYV